MRNVHCFTHTGLASARYMHACSAISTAVSGNSEHWRLFTLPSCLLRRPGTPLHKGAPNLLVAACTRKCCRSAALLHSKHEQPRLQSLQPS